MNMPTLSAVGGVRVFHDFMNNVCISFVALQDYIDRHPETIILDPLPAIRTLLDRCKSYQLIHRLESCMKGATLPLETGCVSLKGILFILTHEGSVDSLPPA